jgi:hypothetical protein
MTKQRTPAQIAAMRAWRAKFPEQFQAWVESKGGTVWRCKQKVADESLFVSQEILHMTGPRIVVRDCWTRSPVRIEVEAWINDRENMLTSHGKLSRFAYRRKGRACVFSFSQPEVSFAFKMRFG